MNSEDYKPILTAIYQKYNPDKIQDIDNLLLKYNDNKDALLKSIFTKYNIIQSEQELFINHIGLRDSHTAIMPEEYISHQKKNNRNNNILYALIILLGLFISSYFIFKILELKKENKEIEKTDQLKKIKILNKPIIESSKLKKYDALDLLDLIKLREEPNNTKTIESKGYKYLHTINLGNGDDKIYLGSLKDTISIFYHNITWRSGTNRHWLFNHFLKQAKNTSALIYDEEYSNAEIGDEPEIPIYSNNYCFFSDDGTEHMATIFYSDKTKKIEKGYAFYVGESE